MQQDMRELFSTLQEHYTPEEAKAAIDSLLSPYGETVRITFRRTDAEIIDSYRVDSRNVRHVVCEIIHRTGFTERSYENLAAEWMVHNASYTVGVCRADAKDVSLDYAKDPRMPILLATEIFDKLDIE